MKIVGANTPREDKPSRWWMAYHLWGGLCLLIFAEISGFYDLLRSTLTSLIPIISLTPMSAHGYAGIAGLLTSGIFVTIGYFLSKRLVDAINSVFSQRNTKRIIKIVLPFVYFFVATLLGWLTITIPLFRL